MPDTVKKQEKRLRAKLQLQQGEDEDLEDQDEEDDEDGALWGAKKRAYYDADEQVTLTRCPTPPDPSFIVYFCIF